MYRCYYSAITLRTKKKNEMFHSTFFKGCEQKHATLINWRKNDYSFANVLFIQKIFIFHKTFTKLSLLLLTIIVIVIFLLKHLVVHPKLSRKHFSYFLLFFLYNLFESVLIEKTRNCLWHFTLEPFVIVLLGHFIFPLEEIFVFIGKLDAKIFFIVQPVTPLEVLSFYCGGRTGLLRGKIVV